MRILQTSRYILGNKADPIEFRWVRTPKRKSREVEGEWGSLLCLAKDPV
jgi:hypothetical protein